MRFLLCDWPLIDPIKPFLILPLGISNKLSTYAVTLSLLTDLKHLLKNMQLTNLLADNYEHSQDTTWTNGLLVLGTANAYTISEHHLPQGK